MAKEDNLRPVRTTEEARERGRKGGIASAKTRRKKANLKKAMNDVLSCDVNSEQIKKILKELDLPCTNEYALSLSVIAKGIKKGNPEALRAVNEVVKEKDRGDKSEQRARIAKIKAETTRIGGDEEVEYIDDIEGGIYGDNTAKDNTL